VVAASRGKAEWRGTVVDAHDASPVAGARLSIVVPTFEGDGVVSRTVGGVDGTFVLEGSWQSDARLVVDASVYTRYEEPLPPPSVLSIAIVTRRRALLDRIVRWARQHGAPFDATPEPTPGHVRRAARRADAEDIAAWADRVERAAFGAEPMTDLVEQEVRNAEPGRSRGPGQAKGNRVEGGAGNAARWKS
jgi:hypothetical protein